MVRKKDVDLCCGFSRKELQNFCKKYNLPANRSSTDMAESLAVYFEKNNLNSVGIGVAGNRDSEASTSRVVTSTWDVSKDSYGNGLDRYKEICIQAAMAKEPLMILVDETLYQEQNGNGGLIDSAGAPPCTRRVNEKGQTENTEEDVTCRTDSRLENRKKKVDSGSSTSFKFDVKLEEGISLSVDIDYNPSDWIKSLRDEVNVYDSLRPRKPPHSDNGISKATESTEQKSSGKDKDGEISPANQDNAQLPSDHHSNSERSLASSALEPCNGNKETNGHLLTIPDSLVPSQIVSSCVEPYSKSCRVHPVELDCVIPPVKKLRSDSVTVAAHPAGDLVIEIPDDPSTEILQKVGTSSAVICPLGAGSKFSSSEAEAYHSNPRSSPLKTSRPEFSSYSESFKFQYNGGKNSLPPNSFEQ